jgi:hypothetical protein
VLSKCTIVKAIETVRLAYKQRKKSVLVVKAKTTRKKSCKEQRKPVELNRIQKKKFTCKA